MSSIPTDITVHELSQNPFSPSEIESGLDDSPSKPTDSKDEEEPPKSLCQRHRVLIGIVSLCAIIAVASSVVPTRQSSTSFDLLDPSSWLPSLLDHLDYNPHGGDSPFDFSLWNTGRGCDGLEINILDNLEDKWKPFLESAVSDWDNGVPDALTINVREVTTYDPDCSPVRNLLKVCNGDYGSTDWVGINIALVIDGFISSSVAKMNDFFLDRMNDGTKQWTMCHELGHGLGLGHWDERFYNRDLGNCMDYTSRTRKEKNQRPDASNFVFLEQMYGNIDGTSVYSAKSVVNGTDDLHCSSAELNKRRSLIDLHPPSDEDFARYIDLMVSNPALDVDKSSSHHPQAHMGWRYLSRTESREVHELEIEEGVKVITTFHLA